MTHSIVYLDSVECSIENLHLSAMAEEQLPGYTPQSIADILPIYHGSDPDSHPQTYTLRQLTATSQTLSPKDNSSTEAPYHIKIFATGGFMNKRPHIIISKLGRLSFSAPSYTSPEAPPSSSTTSGTRRRSLFRRDSNTPAPSTPSPTTSTKDTSGPLVAKVRFDIHSTGTGITYPSTSPPNHPVPPPKIQRLELSNPISQTLTTSIRGRRHYWQPHPGNKKVLELMNEIDEVVARFTHNPELDLMALLQNEKKSKKSEAPQAFVVGELHLVEGLLPADGTGARADEERWRAKEEVLCSAITVVERAKRRAANCGLSKNTGAYSGALGVGNLGGWVGGA